MLAKIIKKLIPFIFALSILVAGFSMASTQAVADELLGTCEYTTAQGNRHVKQTVHKMNKVACESKMGSDGNNAIWTPYSSSNPAPKQESELEKNLDDCENLLDFSLEGCIQKVTYVFFVTLPSMLMAVFAKMFDFTAALTLSSNMYKADFVASIWTVVRDLANIFFILILLYAAIQKILDLGHGEANKIVATVIMVALLVNFSLFFTKVVIDASNITALVFYNKINTSRPVQNAISANQGEKELGAALISGFDVNAFFSGTFFENLKQDPRTPQLSTTFKISLMVIYGIIAFALSYAFLMAGISMLGRMLTLMMLMIVSPVAFVTRAVPSLRGKDTIGFDSWIGQLFQTSFMAAIFMFILYVISEILNAKIFASVADSNNKGAIAQLIILFMPAVLIVILLLKGVKYAKSASGQFTDIVMSGLKTAGVVGIGGAALGTAFVGRNTVGAFMKGASTGDTAANRIQQNTNRIVANRAILNNPNSNIVERFKARSEIFSSRKDQLVGLMQQGTGIAGAQRTLGNLLNTDQVGVRHAAHARHELDSIANTITHGSKKKWDELNGQERYEAREKMARDRAVRENSGNNAAANPLGIALQGRKWDSLTQQERDIINNAIGSGAHGPVAGGLLATQQTWDDLHTIVEARPKQGIISSVVQSGVTGTYDLRNVAEVVAKEQGTMFSKLTAGIVGAIGLSMRGGFKQMGVDYGKGQGAFFKDLGTTISDALKNVKINVDLSHVGDEKKESHGGGGGHH